MKKSSKTLVCAHCGFGVPDQKAMDQHQAKYPCGAYLKISQSQTCRVFKNHVDVEPPTAQQVKARAEAMVCADSQMRTVLAVRRTASVVTFISHTQAGVTIDQLPIKNAQVVYPDGKKFYEVDKGFDGVYKPIPDYPTGRAAKLIVGSAQHFGGTKTALDELAQLIDISPKERQVASDKMASNTKTQTVTKVVNAGKHGKVTTVTGKKPRDSASSLFKQLIMEGHLTDEEVFLKVKAAYQLDNAKRSYVNYYRNALKKEGKNPPPAKGGVKKVETKKAKKR